jgi:hypothetical protein
LMVGAATLYYLRVPKANPASEPHAIWRAEDGLE